MADNFTTFLDVWPTVQDMASDYEQNFQDLIYLNGEYVGEDTFLSDTAATVVWTKFFSCMEGRHGADEVVYDPNIGDGLLRWKLKFLTIINNHGLEFVEKIKLQARIRAMTDEELMESGLDVNTIAYNPAQAPTATFTDTDIEKVETINTQTAKRGKRSIADAMILRERLLSFDYWEDFLRLFDPLFKKILATPWRDYEITEDTDE